MTTVYEAEPPHVCDMRSWRDTMPLGSIVKCDDCGLYWLRQNTYECWVEYWHPVRWWNFRARRIIKDMG